MRVEYSNFKLSQFKRTTPKAIGGNVQPGTIGSDCRATSEGFTSDGLQGRIYAYITANFREPITNRVSDFILSDVGKATFEAGERVFHRKMCRTGTIQWRRKRSGRSGHGRYIFRPKKSEMIAEAERRRTRTRNSGNHTYSNYVLITHATTSDYTCALVSARFYFSARCEFFL